MANHLVTGDGRAWRARLAGFMESGRVQYTVIALIVTNAITLGFETSPPIIRAAGGVIEALDHIILSIFVVEIALRIAAHGWRFFRDPWSLFDFIVVAIALIPASGSFAVLRALRILRLLRLLTMVPQMRRVISALLSAIPGLSSIIVVLLLV